jgi:hypothetical protein
MPPVSPPAYGILTCDTKKIGRGYSTGGAAGLSFSRSRPFYFPAAAGHFPPTRFLLLLTHPYSSNLASIFLTCLSSYHTGTYTRPHIYPTSLPTPNITSLTSSFTSSQLSASHTSFTSSHISFRRFPSSPFSFVRHPHPFKHILSLSPLSHCCPPSHCNTFQFYGGLCPPGPPGLRHFRHRGRSPPLTPPAYGTLGTPESLRRVRPACGPAKGVCQGGLPRGLPRGRSPPLAPRPTAFRHV